MSESLNEKSWAIEVVIPVWNGQAYILDAIRSIERQTVKPAKIIVVDDGSTDTTVRLVREHSGPVPIECVEKEHSGLSPTRNQGIRRSTTPYIAFLDADDLWDEKKLEEQLQVFRTTELTNVACVYSDYSQMNEYGQLYTPPDSPVMDRTVRGRVFEKLLHFNSIIGSASGVLIKRECLDRVGYFDETLTATEDWDLWLRLAEHYSFDYAKDPLVKIRRHSGNMQKNAWHMFSNKVRFFNKWLTRLPADIDVPRRWAEYLIITMLYRLPKLDYYRFYKQTVRVPSHQILVNYTIRKMKFFLLIRILLLPVIVWVNRLKQHSA